MHVSTGILKHISQKHNNELMVVEVSKKTLQISERGQLEDAKKKTTESTASQVYVQSDLFSVGKMGYRWAVLEIQSSVTFIFFNWVHMCSRLGHLYCVS